AGKSSPAARRLRADQRIDARRVLRIDAEGNAPDVILRESFRELGPVLSRIPGLPNPAFGTAADHLSDRAAPLVRRRIDHVGVLRIEHDVADSRVVTDVKHALPLRAAVDRLVEAALAAGGPQRALRGDVDDVRVARIDQ